MDRTADKHDPNESTGSHPVSASSSRRSFLHAAAGAAAGGAALFSSSRAAVAQSAAPARHASYIDLLRIPDQVAVFERFDGSLPARTQELTRSSERWTGSSCEVETAAGRSALKITLASPLRPVSLVHLRWNSRIDPGLLVLGDAWERSYGDLGWRNIVPERSMPWYFATWDKTACHGYGVQTDARALCCWTLDQQGISLWLNVTNGGNGVELGQRRLTMATVVTHRGADGESAFDAVTALCRSLCARPSRKLSPIYGANDWDYAYGASTAATIVRDTEFIANLAPSRGPRPFSVVDGGWENGTAAWPDMGKLAADIRSHKVRPGIWIRPLEAPKNAPSNNLVSAGRAGGHKDRAAELAYDPTVPEARQRIAAKVQQVRDWGYELIKHDFSTYDLLGRWGFEMGPQPTVPGWSLYDKSKTNAEVIAELYALIRETAGEAILIDGCNTVGHLGQGVFEMQRIGDDTSGHYWERTRRMGINTAAFRLPQNGTFFTIDPDMVGITDTVPWDLNRQWLDLLARSGAVTIVAPGPAARGAEQKAAIREAFAIAADGGTGARPVDWMETSAPARWTPDRSTAGSKKNAERSYDWSGLGGTSPFIGS